MSVVFARACAIMFIVLVGAVAILQIAGYLIPPVASVLFVVCFFGLAFSFKEFEEQLTKGEQ